MIPGYNHNIRYRDQVFHIQTEDSGVHNPHIITHVFVGGNIVESRKTSYADIVNSERLGELLVDLMQDQHKGMIKDLIGGRLDAKISERSAGAGKLNGPAPLNVEAGAQNRVSLFGGGGGGATLKKPQPPVLSPPKVAPPAVKLPPPPAVKLPPPPLRSVQMPEPTSIFADTTSSFFGDAPPAEQVIEAETLARAFASNDETAVDSIFGEDLISEKSLDEVILSYLAEDMRK
ncbi:MAG: hypothetical protein A2289_23915 [Deltaproteobacteria bacterium RIFOXYA12_FULL_58_15]|nr:MAG: hypothetical protein A2289_23915 [Deltaproteobacteria bacterium RIFOXYA12_FULL_58_15]